MKKALLTIGMFILFFCAISVLNGYLQMTMNGKPFLYFTPAILVLRGMFAGYLTANYYHKL